MDDASTGGARPVADAATHCRETAEPVDRTDRVPLSAARDRVLSEPVAARRAVPDADVAAGEELLPADRRLSAADLAALKAAGLDEVRVRERPTVGIVPVGEDLVQREPDADERVERTAFAVAELADAWGATTTYRTVVDEARPTLRAAVQRDLTKDAVILTGVGADHPIRDVLEELGTIDVAGLAAEPGGQVAVGTVEDRHVLLLGPDLADCVVGAVQLLRPLLAALSGGPLAPLPVRSATLTAPVESRQGVASFVPVATGDGGPTAPSGDPTGGDGTLAGSETLLRATPLTGESSAGEAVHGADGWVVVAPAEDGLVNGDEVRVQDWTAAR